MDKNETMKIKKIEVGEIKTNCYLVSVGSDIFIVDPGGDPAKIIAEIENFSEPNVKYILLTHGHYDHILAVDDLFIKYPKTSIVIHESDLELYNNLPNQGLFAQKSFHRLRAGVTPIAEGSALSFGDSKIKVLHTPGHTKGSVCYLIDNMLFSGDTIFYRNYGRIDLPWSEPGSMKDSIDKILSLPEDLMVYPGHGEETTIKDEKSFKNSGVGEYL